MVSLFFLLQNRQNPWFLHHPRLAYLGGTVFSNRTFWLDRICIDQENLLLKSQALKAVGAFVANADQLVLLLDETYFGRLWCIYVTWRFKKGGQMMWDRSWSYDHRYGVRFFWIKVERGELSNKSMWVFLKCLLNTSLLENQFTQKFATRWGFPLFWQSHVENVGVSVKLLGYDGIHCHFGSARIHEVERLNGDSLSSGNDSQFANWKPWPIDDLNLPKHTVRHSDILYVNLP